MAPKSEVDASKIKTAKPSGALGNLKKLATSSQLYWFLAHFLSLLTFVAWQIFGFFSKKLAQKYSKLTLISQLAAYGIVIWKSVPVSKTKNKIQLLRNENVQYFGLALILLVTSLKLDPWTKAVTSFIIFSFFHSITYIQKNLLNHMPISLHAQAAISDRITFLTSNFNLQALSFASLSELLLLIDILLGVPGLIFSIFRSPLYVLFFVVRSLAVVVFLKLRYDESQYTKQAVQQFDARIGGLLSNPMVPPQLAAIYFGPIRSNVVKYSGYVLIPKITSGRKTQ